MDDDTPANKVIGFPYARSGLSKTRSEPRNLGLTALSRALSGSGAGAKGHWCKNCKGIRYSYFGEAECPVCGGRS